MCNLQSPSPLPSMVHLCSWDYRFCCLGQNSNTPCIVSIEPVTRFITWIMSHCSSQHDSVRCCVVTTWMESWDCPNAQLTSSKTSRNMRLSGFFSCNTSHDRTTARPLSYPPPSTSINKSPNTTAWLRGHKLNGMLGLSNGSKTSRNYEVEWFFFMQHVICNTSHVVDRTTIQQKNQTFKRLSNFVQRTRGTYGKCHFKW